MSDEYGNELLRGRLLDLMEEHGPSSVLEKVLVTLVEESPVRVRYALEILEDTGLAVRSPSAEGECWSRNV